MKRLVILPAVWGYAAWVWASIGHTFMGLPDVGPLLASAVFVAIVVPQVVKRSSSTRARSVAPSSTPIASPNRQS